LDAFVFFILGLPSGVSRIENARIPFMGPLVRAIQPILVSREDSQNKILVIEEIKKRAAPDSDWPQLLVFPEGTTTNRSCLITFKPGAFIPGLPVQPIVVQYTNKLDTITWTWEGFKAFEVVFYTLCQFSNFMEVTYLPVYVPNEQEKMDAKLFARNVRSKIAELVI
jgi:lysophosphatidylcholine acyltransferase / lyso-PAF acetyltransferase